MNEEANIQNCLNSLMSQTRRPDEVIVVDNESEDNTVAIATRFGARILSYPRPDVRHGNIGLVRQHGTEEANGDVVVSTDADAVHPKAWLQKIESHFLSNPKLVLLGGPVYLIEEDPLPKFFSALHNFHISYWSGWGVPLFLAANTSFRKSVFMLTEGYKGAAGHGPVEEWIISFRLSRMGEWMWDDEVYCYAKCAYARDLAYVMVGSTALTVPLQTWVSLTTLAGAVA